MIFESTDTSGSFGFMAKLYRTSDALLELDPAGPLLNVQAFAQEVLNGETDETEGFHIYLTVTSTSRTPRFSSTESLTLLSGSQGLVLNGMLTVSQERRDADLFQGAAYFFQVLHVPLTDENQLRFLASAETAQLTIAGQQFVLPPTSIAREFTFFDDLNELLELVE